ncbi:MAG: hypothetical protein U5K75_09200 [Ahrensia sp.]|nr:hypothetical protein [Ahrensia sp.]
MMALKNTILTGIVAGALGLTLLPPLAAAQSMSPMRGKVSSFADSYALKVYPANPYEHRIRVEVKAYDANFRPLKDVKINPSSFTLAAQANRQVTVVVPFNGEKQSRVRICTESIPFPGKATNNIKAQICGKFIGERN